MLNSPVFEVFIRSFLPVYLGIGERLPHIRSTLDTSNWVSVISLWMMNGLLKGLNILSIGISHKAENLNSTRKLPFLNFFSDFFRKLASRIPKHKIKILEGNVKY